MNAALGARKQESHGDDASFHSQDTCKDWLVGVERISQPSLRLL
jgi:hypothetical protein